MGNSKLITIVVHTIIPSRGVDHLNSHLLCKVCQFINLSYVLGSRPRFKSLFSRIACVAKVSNYAVLTNIQRVAGRKLIRLNASNKEFITII